MATNVFDLVASFSFSLSFSAFSSFFSFYGPPTGTSFPHHSWWPHKIKEKENGLRAVHQQIREATVSVTVCWWARKRKFSFFFHFREWAHKFLDSLILCVAPIPWERKKIKRTYTLWPDQFPDHCVSLACRELGATRRPQSPFLFHFFFYWPGLIGDHRFAAHNVWARPKEKERKRKVKFLSLTLTLGPPVSTYFFILFCDVAGL